MSAAAPAASPAPSLVPSPAAEAAAAIIREAAEASGVELRHLVGRLFGGLFLPDGAPVEDVGLVYRIVGVEDLGRNTRGGRGQGSEVRAAGTRSRAGRAQSKTRREGEHA